MQKGLDLNPTYIKLFRCTFSMLPKCSLLQNNILVSFLWECSKDMPTYKITNGVRIPFVQNLRPTSLKFLTEDIFVTYLDVLFKKKISKHVCSRKLIASNEYFVKLDIPSLIVNVSKTLMSRFNECALDDSKKYFIVPLHIRFPSYYTVSDRVSDTQTIGHANTVLVDRTRKEIELFEPHGQFFKGHPVSLDTQAMIKEIVTRVLPFTQDYVFKNVFSTCESLAPQKDDLYCLAWTLLYIELRLLNGNLDSSTVFGGFHEYFNTQSQKLNYIKRYITFVKGQIEKYPSREHNMYPDYDFPISHLDTFVVNPADFKVRLIGLMYLYSSSQDTLQRQQILNELLSYRKHSRFDDTFFNFFSGRYNDAVKVFDENKYIFDHFNDSAEFARLFRTLVELRRIQLI
ncbi:hypothetical protein EBZ39_04410 [bacterium]|nr:hypothetical protein [bacterium]